MKKTININLARYPFTIDEDAYSLLKDYLDTIRYAFETKADTDDLAADIEARIAEILIEKEGASVRIVSLEEISQIIERIGKPSQFINTETEGNKPQEEIHIEMESSDDKEKQSVNFTENICPPPFPPFSQSSFRKKLFRDPQNAMLGGVCSGLAIYLNIDITIVRLLTVALFFLSASTVAIAYIILWIVVPEARTPLQKMQMKGENPSVENIGKTVTMHYSEEWDCDNQISKKGFNRVVSSCLSVFVKCLLILGLIIALPLLVAFGTALLGCAIAFFIVGIGLCAGSMFDSMNEGLLVLYILLAVIGGIITIGIPLWLFVKRFWIKKEYSPNTSGQKAMLIVWLCGIALLAVFSVKSARKAHDIEISNWNLNFENIQQLDEMNEEDLEDIKINNGNIIITTKDGKSIQIFGKKSKSNIKTDETSEILTETEIIDSININPTDSITKQ